MRRLTLLIATFIMAALLAAGLAYAKPSTVKCANCRACHEVMPPKKDNLNKKAVEMAAKFKLTECKKCHIWAGGKLSIPKKK